MVILYEFLPSLLPHIQLLLSEEVFQAFMVREYFTLLPIEIGPLDFQGIFYCRKLQVMRGVVLIIVL
jgi:hypothetical protein